MKIKVNNDCIVEIESTDYGVIVSHLDSNGNVEYRRKITEGEIIMLLNLHSYMMDNNFDSVYFPYSQSDREYFAELIRNGNINEFRIF